MKIKTNFVDTNTSYGCLATEPHSTDCISTSVPQKMDAAFQTCTAASHRACLYSIQWWHEGGCKVVQSQRAATCRGGTVSR